MKAVRLPVKSECGQLSPPMTRAQARRRGNANMPQDLRRAGFETVIFESDPQIHGGHYFRINYGMKC